MCTEYLGKLPHQQLVFVWAFRCVGVCVSKVVCVQRRVQALDTHRCTTLWAWRHLTLNNRCGCSEYLMGGGCRCMQTFMRAHSHAHTKWKWKYNIHACMTFRLKLLGKWSLCSRVMLSVKDTVEFRQTATLAFTPSSLFSRSPDRALRIVLAARRDLYPHLSLRSLHLHRHPPRTAWPWITGAACTQRGPSRAQWKPAEQRTAQLMPPVASVLKWVPASSSVYNPHQVFALRESWRQECRGIYITD